MRRSTQRLHSKLIIAGSANTTAAWCWSNPLCEHALARPISKKMLCAHCNPLNAAEMNVAHASHAALKVCGACTRSPVRVRAAWHLRAPVCIDSVYAQFLSVPALASSRPSTSLFSYSKFIIPAKTRTVTMRFGCSVCACVH